MAVNNEIFQKLWNLLDSQRGNGNIDILKYIVPDLVFLFAISVKYEKEKNKAPLHGKNDPIYYTLILPVESRWETILQSLKENPTKIKENVYQALEAIEKRRVKNKESLDGLTHKERFRDKDLTAYNLQTIIEKLDEEFQKHTWDYDFFGATYQFFLKQFATRGGKSGGEFYTPLTVVQLLVNLIQPFEKSFVYDPCCGSGGMFVQSKVFIKKNKGHSVICLGQEIIPDTLRLAKMRLIIEGLNFHLALGDTLFEDQHANQEVDFVLANPPFNQKRSDFSDNDYRWKKYGLPNDANYGWLSHIIYKLKTNGVGAIIMSNGTLSSLNKKELVLREKWINDNLVEAIITLPNNLFYTTSIAPCIWILRKGRENSNILMIDISADDFGEKLSSSERILTEADINAVVKVYENFREKNIIEATNISAQIISKEEVAEKNFVLVPSRYLQSNEEKLSPEEIDEKLLKNSKELRKLIEEQEKYHQELKKMLNEVEKEIKNNKGDEST